MELNDLSDERLRESKSETRSPLGIDLNEIPSSSFAEAVLDSFDVVRAFHDNPDPAPGPPAVVPGEGRGSVCGACGRPEVRGHVVVCDGCERGFHLGCAGMRGRQAVNLAEWVCGECMSSGLKSKRWPLGVKSKRILDINASPPSDGDGDGSEDLQDLRKHTPGDDSFGGNAFGAPVTYSNFLYAGNGFGFQKASGILTHTVKVGFDDILRHTQTTGRSFEDIDLGFQLGRLRNSNNNTAISFPSRNPSEIFLQGLREFISERHGVLEEGWCVELKCCSSSYELYAVYRAPDGKTFDSMFEVACYLGLMSNYNSTDTEIKTEGSSLQERLHLPKKRKSTRFSIANGFAENMGTLISGYCKELSSDGQSMEVCASKCSNIAKVTEAGTEENGGIGSQQSNDGLPVQFEDFFILSLGQVDVRSSYHDVSLICPVGYRSCWHDKITGSLFMCEVSDGGDAGPVFKVRRCSCSALPIPNGSTVLFRPNFGQFSGKNNEESNDITYYNRDYDNDGSVQMILSDPCPPMENDILTCLGSSLNETYDVQTFGSVLEASSGHDKSDNLFSDNLGLRDEIGEILVEKHSSSSAWRMMSQKFIDACTEICKQKGTLKFFCKHAENELGSRNWDAMDEKKNVNTSLAKFCGLPVSLVIPSEYRENELATLADVLSIWLDQDRFGLDAEFVQEIIEQLPGVEACLQYVLLKNRSCYAASVTVGNGILMVNTKDGVEGKEEDAPYGLFRRSKKPRLVENHVMDDRCPPPGKPLCLKLPPELVGDFYQVWELLWRFHEVLGLKEPFSLEELEEELINPWFDGSNLLEKFEREIQGTEVVNLHRIDGMDRRGASSSSESHLAVSRESPHAFIQLETGVLKEPAQARLTSFTCSRCSGVALTRAHSSLLGVLISELQSKVAALVDPNFDSGESKSKRGRKKDTESSVPSRRNKLNMLPINELTWPELARRYILAVLSMDCNLDSAEITARESGKVFRCLQGDGGVLCGSLTGVAGMEADALLLAEAMKKIFGSLNRENDVLTIEDEGSDVTGAFEKNTVNDGNIPEWAQMLEPVRKLPTNVGTRIRKCVYDALEKGPPEWAKKILEHSISKEVYKGNASGPTKKAVLSVLGDVHREGLPQKSNKGSRRKNVISISDIIMKQCRFVLRRAAAADDAKVFCNLLGRKLINTSDNDDEGLLGSPAMVSRPLDFRTIDLRLAVGAYSGSHEAFVADVRELWNNVRTAYGDQPDLVELAETLSQNFESLYEKEVITLVQKFLGFAKLECLSAERKKEINDIIASTNEIPKAPWDEGVCKVCGIDKDDDSVLLCDTCDAEYHTYCLNPPLARIPEGNWYCPSCVVGIHMVQDASECSQITGRRRGKKYQGEVSRVYSEALTHLAAIMEEKEYWEFSVDERTFLLKFLCDELLNSTLIRQHLEQCAEATAELQQKLRTFSVECKNLKSREEILVARAAKVGTSMHNAVGEVGTKEGFGTVLGSLGKCVGHPHNLSDASNYCSVLSDDVSPLEGGREGTGLNGFDKSPSANCSEKNYTCNSQVMTPMDAEGQLEDAHAVANDSKVPCHENDKSFKPNELPLSNSLSQEINDSTRETHFQGNLPEYKEGDIGSPPPASDHQGPCLASEMTSLHVAQHVPSVAVNESNAYHLELNTVKNDILLLQDSITSLESQLLKLSVRREFLGSDSGGRLYWVSAMPSRHPWVIVDESLAVQHRRKTQDGGDPVGNSSVLQNSASSGIGTCLNLEGSNACCPFLYALNDDMAICPPWVSYRTDAEIVELVGWLKDNDPKERELKESILQWQKLRFQDSQQTRNQVEDEQQTVLSVPADGEKDALSNCLFTKAATLLEKKYGPCFDSETTEVLKKRGKKTRLTNEGKMYRCECLEPIWPSRNHCLSCHRTFSTDDELKGHCDGRCISGPPAYEKSKEISDCSKGKGNPKSDMLREECAVEMDVVETSKSECSELSSRLIKFQNDGLVCPFDLQEISSKFVTKDSNKELLQGIGLISSNGIPSFVPSISPFLNDPALMFIPPQEEVGVLGDEFKATERLGFSQGNRGVTNAGHDSASDNPSIKSAANDICQVLKTNRTDLGNLEQRDKKSSLGNRFQDLGAGHCCVVSHSSLKPLVGKVSQILRQLKITLLDIDATLPEEAFRPSKAHLERRWAWRAFVKSAETIYEMVQATIVLEDMIKTEYLRNEWWYWSSLSAAAKTSTMCSLALRIYSLDAAIIYDKSMSNLDPIDNSGIPDQKLLPTLDVADKCRVSRKSNKKRKEPEG